MPTASNERDSKWMKRALAQAARGRGLVEPNPMVGCVIVNDDVMVGEGFHTKVGAPHAEREALAASLGPVAGATAYVTLEPCSHLEKKTPPCVPALIEAKLARVVIACEDPNPSVAGKGIAQLREAGLQVDVGVLEREARQLNAPFFARMKLHRPYVTLKWAQSVDGKVAGAGGKPVMISNELSRHLTHRLRARCDAILVGINTILKDNPLLTARGVEIQRPLRRAILDMTLRIPLDARVLASREQGPVTVFCSDETYRTADQRVGMLQADGVEVQGVPVGANGKLSLPHILRDLYEDDVTHLLVEGGPTVARSFMDENLADRAWVFHSPREVNESSAPNAPAIDWPAVAERGLGDDELKEHFNTRSEVFFASTGSVDLPQAEERVLIVRPG